MTNRHPRDIEVLREPEPVPYDIMLPRQMARHREVAEGSCPNTLFLLQHEPVVTLGKETEERNLLLSPEALEARGIAVCPASRGGDVTYHGPGQLVAYPILNLQDWKPSVGWYLRTLESVLIELLADYGLVGTRVDGRTGVWVNDAKVAAIGIGVRRWTTFHGIALNVAPDMEHFNYIVPCGIADKPVTSLAALLEEPPTLESVADRFEVHFRRCFGLPD